MSKRTATIVAWSLWGLGMIITALTVILDGLNGHRATAPAVGELSGTIALTVGGLIVSRRPSNRIGWLLLLARVLLAFGGSGDLADQYTLYTLVTRPGALPAGAWVQWLGLITQIVGFVPLATFLPLLFPDGRPPSPRSRPLVWLTTFLLGMFAIGAAFQPVLNNGPVDVRNPLGVGAWQGLSDTLAPFLTVLSVIVVTLCVLSVFVRFRRARGDERQQLKWFAFGALLLPIAFLIGALASLLNVPAVLDLPLWQASVAGIPIAIGIAVLKYRLYDIDVIIRRTLIYGVLSAVLALFYFISVVVLQQLFRSLTGQESDLAIIISTLAIAALFTPVRSRVQAAIDHRFYRRKYNAQQVLSAFSTTVRDEVDLNRLTDELLAVVEETMQPAQVNLWLRTSPRAPSPPGQGRRRDFE